MKLRIVNNKLQQFIFITDKKIEVKCPLTQHTESVRYKETAKPLQY